MTEKSPSNLILPVQIPTPKPILNLDLCRAGEIPVAARTIWISALVIIQAQSTLYFTLTFSCLLFAALSPASVLVVNLEKAGNTSRDMKQKPYKLFGPSLDYICFPYQWAIQKWALPLLLHVFMLYLCSGSFSCPMSDTTVAAPPLCLVFGQRHCVGEWWA